MPQPGTRMPAADTSLRWTEPSSAGSRGCLPGPRRNARLVGLLLGLYVLAAPGAAYGGGQYVLAREQPFTPRLHAYAQVVPTNLLRVRARLAGTIEGLSCLPGDPVQAGAAIARLEGAEVAALVAVRSAAVKRTEADLVAARQSLAIERHKMKAHLSTRLAVDQAQATLAEAEARASVARARLQAAHDMRTLRSPVEGRVLALHGANGEHVEAGEAVVSIEPTHGLWLRATFYGAHAAAIRVGMHGSFAPFHRGRSEPVRVRSVFAKLEADGGEGVGLVAENVAPGWKNGESGTLTVVEPERSAVAIPTRALILDRGRWWVLVHTSQGDRRQPVKPGPSRGDTTLIEEGLAAGTPVVVENAYLEFHQRISGHYHPPD